LPRSGDSANAPQRMRSAAASRSLDSVRAEQAAQPSRRELGAEDRRRRRSSLPVAEPRRVEVGRSPPAVTGQLVDLLLLDEEARAGEEARPAADVVLSEPAVVARLAARNGDEE